MHPTPPNRFLYQSLAALVLLLSPLWLGLSLHAADTGSIAVSVSSRTTGRFLDRARIEIPASSRGTNTDSVGVAEFGGVAPGDHELVVSYIGMREQRVSVRVEAGAVARVNVEMEDEDILELAAFTVNAEREGNAASIARQKNAGNVENVIAMDALGRLANDNPSELLIRLPGVTSGFSTEGNANNVMIRGMSSETSAVNVDGAPITSAGQMSRGGVFTSMAATNFDEIQVTKALLPSMSADSMGGRINFKTRPPFDMKTKRGVTVNIAGKWSPTAFDFSPRRESPSLTPNLSFAWRELFDLFGERRNLGLSASFSFNENITQSVRTIARPDYVGLSPRFTYALERRDRVLDRVSSSGSIRADLKFSDTANVSFSYMRNHLREFTDRPGKFIYDVVASMNSRHRVLQSESAADGAIMNNSTELVTNVRARANTFMEITTDPSGAEDLTEFVRTNGEFRLGDWNADWNASFSTSTREQKPRGARHNYAGNRLLGRRTNIGFTIDKSQSVDFPAFTQTTGASVYDPNNYTLTLTQQQIDAQNDAIAGGFNLRRDLDLFGQSVRIRGGLHARTQKFGEANRNVVYSYTGTDKARFVSVFDMDDRVGIDGLPVWDPAKYGASLATEPTLWNTNPFNTLASERAGLRDVTESVNSLYAMGETVFGQLNVITGARVEWTRNEATGYRRNTADDTKNYTSVADVDKAYPGQITYRRNYADLFPGVHFRYQLSKRWIARASVSTSIARPEIADLLPSYAVNTTEQRITLNNPDIQPAYAVNYDLALEYYMRQVGLFTVGVFRKDISDFIYTGNMGEIEAGVDYGFDSAPYVGYDLYTIANGSKGRVDGIEVAYAQQLSFLPGFLRGLNLNGNYTRLKASGDYGDNNEFSLVGFIPETANARVSYSWRPITVYAQWTYRGDTPATYAVDQQRRVITLARTFFGAGVNIRLGRGLEAYIDANNLLDAPSRTVQYGTGMRLSTNYNGPFITVGVGGRF